MPTICSCPICGANMECGGTCPNSGSHDDKKK